MVHKRWVAGATCAVMLMALTVTPGARGRDDSRGELRYHGRRAKNVIFFVGDGMGVSTVTAGRVFSVGVDGQLVLDQFPHTALLSSWGHCLTSMATAMGMRSGRCSSWQSGRA